MPSINGNTVALMKGEVQRARQTVEDLARPYTDGHAYRKPGKKGPVFRLRTEEFVTGASGGKTRMVTYEALQASLVSVVDSKGQTYNNVMVLDVEKALDKKVLSATGPAVGGGDHLLVVEWVMQDTNI